MVHIHESHIEVIQRLQRAYGHLNKTITMIKDGKPCESLAQQLHAVENAIKNAKKILIYDHINHCLEHSTEDFKEIIENFKKISKYL